MADGEVEVYQMTKPKRGPFIIINNETFANKAKREGTEHDGEKLRATFGGTFGFKVEEHKDVTANGIRDIMQTLGEGDYSDCDCIGIAILTHGEQDSNNIVYGYDGGEVNLYEVFKPLENCQSLAGKPKLILVQAGPLQSPVMKYESSKSGTLPVTSDFSYYFALDVPTGCNGWKFKEHGSIFIQTFCKLLLENSNGEWDVEGLKIRANGEILTISGEMPVSHSTLTRKLFLVKAA